MKISLLTRPPAGGLVVLCLIAMVALWTILCGVSHTAPDLDGMEELVWAASLELGYTKHPPLPSWFMHFATELLGRPVWLPFLMGQLFSALGLWFVWKLGCEITSRHRAFMATLLVSVTAYFSLRGTIYNHNTVQLWSIAASTWLLYRALRDDRPRDWILLGVVCGLAMLTKYSALVQFAAFFLYLLRTGRLREARCWRGLGLAAATFLLVISPHLWWLAQHHFEPLFYADRSLQAGGWLAAWKDLASFTLDQAGRLTPLLVALGTWTLWYLRRGDRSRRGAANDPHFDLTAPAAPRYFDSFTAADRQFLLWVGLTPFVATVLISGGLGTRLEASWASTFFVLFGFYGLWWLRGTDTVQLRRLLIIVAMLHVLMAAGYAVARGPLADLTGRASRSNYPAEAIAAAAQARWAEFQPGRPLRVVASNTWLGGNIAIHTGAQTQVYIDASDEESPWFAPGTALQCGALVAYSPTGSGKASAAVLALYQSAPWKGVDQVRWGPRGPDISLHWAVIPAGERCLRDRRSFRQPTPLPAGEPHAANPDQAN